MNFCEDLFSQGQERENLTTL